MTAVTELTPQQAADAVPVVGRASRGRGLPDLVSAAGRAVGEGCQRCVEVAAGRCVASTVVLVGSWPLLPGPWQVSEVVTAGAIVTAAGLRYRRQSLLMLGKSIRYRSLVRKVIRRWPRVIGVNADIKRIEKAVDVTGAPLRTPGHRHIPVLIHGFRSWRRLGWRLHYFGPRRTPYGCVVTVDGSPVGAVLGAFSSESEVIRGSLDAYAVKASANRHRPHWTDLSILGTDPFAAVISRTDLPGPTDPDSVVVGFDADGDAVEKSLWLPHLTVGESGSGKSSETHVIVAGIADMGVPMRLWVFDPKGGVEFDCYEGTAHRYVRSPYRWVELLRELIEVMQDKLGRLRATGRREVDMFDPAFGLDVLVIDELLSTVNFIDDADHRNKVRVVVDGESRLLKPSEAFNHLLSQQRAARIVTLANSQMAQKEKIKNRDMFPNITCLRVGFDETVTMLGFSAKEHPAHQIPIGPRFSGIGYTRTSNGIVKYRAAFMSDSERAETAKRVARWTQFYRERDERAAQLRSGQEVRPA